MAPALSSSFYTAPQKSPINPFKPSFEIPNFLKFRKPIFEFKQKKSTALTTINCSKSGRTSAAPATNSNSSVTDPSSAATNGQRHWIVVVKPPSPQQAVSKPDVIDYYVKLLDRVLGSEKEAQGCIYNASYETDFGFCCDLDEETSQELACLPEVLSVKPDPDFNSIQKNYSNTNVELGSYNNIFSSLFPVGSSKHWLVRVEVPTSGVITRAQLVDYYAQILTKVLGNNKDAEMCMYHISQQSDYGFCCELDDECAKELASLPGVLSVRPDENVESDNKDYRENQPINIKTKKLFVTGLSFYTSEKTLRAAFEGFGELVEVKIIMDKISKRSKGFAFIEYTTEEAASAALREMNGKIINGWMIVVDVAKTDPPKYARGRPRPTR